MRKLQSGHWKAFEPKNHSNMKWMFYLCTIFQASGLQTINTCGTAVSKPQFPQSTCKSNKEV